MATQQARVQFIHQSARQIIPLTSGGDDQPLIRANREEPAEVTVHRVCVCVRGGQVHREKRLKAAKIGSAGDSSPAADKNQDTISIFKKKSYFEL